MNNRYSSSSISPESGFGRPVIVTKPARKSHGTITPGNVGS